MKLRNTVGDFEKVIELGKWIPQLTAASDALEEVLVCNEELAEALLTAKRFKEAISIYEMVLHSRAEAKLGISVDLLLNYAAASQGDGQIETVLDAEGIALSDSAGVPDDPKENKLNALMKIGFIGRNRFNRGDLDGLRSYMATFSKVR